VDLSQYKVLQTERALDWRRLTMLQHSGRSDHEFCVVVLPFQLEGHEFKRHVTSTRQHVFSGNWTCSFVRRSSVQGAVKLRVWH
jgi:hypothetical protein